MAGHPIRGTVAVLAAAVLTASLVSTALAADPEVAARKPAVKCDGKVATKVGTPGDDTLVGTAGRDIIAGLGGDDVIYGLGGNDVLCGGSGHDRLFGGPGRDKLLGQTGRDRLRGGTARDRIFGGAHADRLFGQGGPDLLLGGPGNDRLVGGTGIDTCDQNSGPGVLLQCELPAAPVVVPAPAPAPAPKTLAIAYSDLDRSGAYSTGDVLIAKLVDANGDGAVGLGDTIEMGKYPTSLTPTMADFVDWGVKGHAVKSLEELTGTHVFVRTTMDELFKWHKNPGWENFGEEGSAGFSTIQDGLNGTAQDVIFMQPTSPSAPGAFTGPEPVNTTDDRLVDVDLLY